MKRFFRYALRGVCSINECYDGYVMAMFIVSCGRVVRPEGPGEVTIGGVATIPNREISLRRRILQVEPTPASPLTLPVTLRYTLVRRRVRGYQERSISAHFYNTKYLKAVIYRVPRDDFHEAFARMKVVRLYKDMRKA